MYSVETTIKELAGLRMNFSNSATNRKGALLSEICSRSLSSPGLIKQCHAVLLFLLAYPSDPKLFSLASQALEHLAQEVKRISRNRPSYQKLADSGFAGTKVHCAFSVASIAWLLRRFPRDIEIAWDSIEAETLDEIIKTMASYVELDGYIDAGLSSKQWLNLAGAKTPGEALRWIIHNLPRLKSSQPIVEKFVELLGVGVNWRLNHPNTSITFARFPQTTPFYHDRILRHDFALRALLKKRLTPRSLSVGTRRQLCDVLRTALLVRHRETDPVTYMHESDVTLFSLERGVSVALFAMRPQYHLPLESYIGYIAAKNGIPVGYGGAWIFMERAQIGINIFENFRGGESSYIFAQVLRCYRQHFGLQHFLVDPFQFGEGNNEAIRSGAFWFYYRLGFRPSILETRKLASLEWGRMKSRPGYRSTAPTLRRLARANLELKFFGGSSKKRDILEPAQISLGITRELTARFGFGRAKAERWALGVCSRALGIRDLSTWKPDQRLTFARFSVMLSLIEDLPKWPKPAKRELVKLIKAKGSAPERSFISLSQKHVRFRQALAKLSVKGKV